MRFGACYPEVKSLVNAGAPAAGRNVRRGSCVLVMSGRIGPQVHAVVFVTAEQIESRVSVSILDFLVGVCEKLNIN